MAVEGEPGQRVREVFQGRLDEMVARSVEQVTAAEIPFYRGLPAELVRGAIRKVYVAVGEDLERGEPGSYPALLAALGAQRSALGVAVTEMLSGMEIGFETASRCFAEYFADDPLARLWWESMRARIGYAGAAALADAYLEAREKVVRAQADEIVRLSTQVLPLHKGVLLFPLLGVLDAARAQDIMMALLSTVQRLRARVVLIDVSGIARMDAEAAGHLSRTARAVGLLGATAILVGINPEVAQATVAAGVELGTQRTLADLESGMHHALAIVGKAIVDR
jgi:rsbT co-antagonist protein RsbR